MSELLEGTEGKIASPHRTEKATLARILIEGLDALADSNVEQLWIAESQRRYQAYLTAR